MTDPAKPADDKPYELASAPGEIPEARAELTIAKPPKEVIPPPLELVEAKPPKEVIPPAAPPPANVAPAPRPAAGARKPAPRPKAPSAPAVPSRPPMTPQQKRIWLGISAGVALFLGVIALILFSGEDYSKEQVPASAATAKPPKTPSAVPPAAEPPPSSAKVTEETTEDKSKPAEPAPAAEAAELHALQDQINARGLWLLLHELRTEKDKVGALHGEMEELGQKLAQRVGDAVRAGRSVPLGHTLRATDDLQNVEELVRWSNSTTRRESVPRLEQFLRTVKAGQPIKVSVKRDSKDMPLTLQFHADPKWPE